MSIQKLYIDQEVAEYPEVLDIARHLDLAAEIADGSRQVYDSISAAPDPIQKGKTVLYLTRNNGAFIKKCPGTRSYTCCGYEILHIGTFCHMDCTYCILQSYFHPPLMQFFVNHTDLFKELDQIFSGNDIHRIGTGEFTDSLIWESWTDFSSRLVPAFAGQGRAVLELKTKTTAVARLQHLAHRGKTIAAWSVNTPRVIAQEERRTASLAARLKAAAKCESWGYPLAFHFDPIIIYDGCEAEYEQVIKDIFSSVAADNIVWISLGTFRFMPSLKPLIQKRFPKSKIIYGEFISGLDGKMRYFKPLRIEVYRKIVASIRSYAPEVFVYFCMEDDDVWQKTLGFTASENGGLDKMLDEQAIRHCGVSMANEE
ncbi:DNA repair photolyase-like protein [Olavius algarvensis Delta 1 endosymbiont]|nr:DNA repair photolyase-like protein [Olavius algarvensis Delta 1 endosymbiont]